MSIANRKTDIRKKQHMQGRHHTDTSASVGKKNISGHKTVKRNNTVHKKQNSVHPVKGSVRPIPATESAKNRVSHDRKVKKHANPVIAVLRSIRNTYCIIGAVLLTLVIIFSGLFIHFEKFYTDCREKEYQTLSSLKENPFRQTGETVIYDKDKKVITKLHNTGYKYTEIADISPELQKTYISSEDKDFMNHMGFSIKGIGRAAYQYVKNKGRITQGGSTITQQLVKNTMLSSERTFTRKLTEIFLAIDLEKKYTKADIMEFYLNSCFYGNNCTGIYAASEYYFGKTPDELDYCDSAMLAAISKSPSINNPEADTERSLKQRNIVLRSLFDDGLITEKQYKEYCNTGYTEIKHETKAEKSSYAASFAVYCASIKLMEQDGFKTRYIFKDKKDYTSYKKAYSAEYDRMSKKIRSGGYMIYTSIDSKKQKQLQKSIDSKLMALSKEKARDGRYRTQGAAVCIDNETGLVCAISGGRGDNDEYNRAFLSMRQPGSSIKPVLDYAPAFDTGNFYPSRIYADRAIKKGPKNSNGSSTSGNISIRNAVKYSSNTVAFNVLKDIGIKNGLSYLSDMRFSSISYIDNDSPSISIGGFTNGIKVYELAGAYAALENSGKWRTPTCIKEINNVMTGEKWINRQKGKQIYKSSSAYLMTSCLEDVFKDGGTGHGLAVSGQVCAGKTGTTNSMKDGWFCGYTPYYTTCVWVGNDDGSAIYRNFGAVYAGPIWKDFMTDIHKGLKKTDFIKPSTVKKLPVGVYGAPAKTGSTKDYFAVEDTLKAVTVAKSTQEKQNERDILSELEKYEALSPETEWAYYKADDMYDSINASLAGISDDDIRTAYQKRLEDKKAALDKEKELDSDFTMTRSQYEAEKKAREEAVAEKKRQEEEENRKITQAIDRFNKAINMIYDTDDADVMNRALATARKNLDLLTDLDDYSSYAEKYNKAVDYMENHESSQNTESTVDTYDQEAE